MRYFKTQKEFTEFVRAQIEKKKNKPGFSRSEIAEGAGISTIQISQAIGKRFEDDSRKNGPRFKILEYLGFKGYKAFGVEKK